jgi:hypothetical protein
MSSSGIICLGTNAAVQYIEKLHCGHKRRGTLWAQFVGALAGQLRISDVGSEVSVVCRGATW